MQPALTSVKELLGDSGYRSYANSLNRHPVTFHIGISNPSTRISALVNLTCDMMRAARGAGFSAQKLLDDANAQPLVSYDQRSGLEYALETTIGPDVVSVLVKTIPMARRDVIHVLRTDSARHRPHFQLIATTALALKKCGLSPRRIMLDRIAKQSSEMARNG